METKKLQLFNVFCFFFLEKTDHLRTSLFNGNFLKNCKAGDFIHKPSKKLQGEDFLWTLETRFC